MKNRSFKALVLTLLLTFVVGSYSPTITFAAIHPLTPDVTDDPDLPDDPGVDDPDADLPDDTPVEDSPPDPDDVMDNAEDAAGDVVDDTQDAAGEVVDDAMDAAGDVVDDAMDNAEDAMSDDGLTTEPELSSAVNTGTVIGVVSDDIADLSDEGADSIIRQAIEELLDEIKDMTKEEAEEAINEIHDDIKKEIHTLLARMTNNPDDRAKIVRQINHLKSLLARLRAKLISLHPDLAERVKRAKNTDILFDIRWGNLGTFRGCRERVVRDRTIGDRATGDTDRRALIQALEDRENPCETERTEYSGSISVNTGTLTVKKEVLFESSDSVTVASGSSIEFESIIAGHWDGLIIHYAPDEDSDERVKITIKIGDLNETYTGAEALGVKQIGNGHQIKIMRLAQVISGLTNSNRARLIAHKIGVQGGIGKLREKIKLLRYLDKSGFQIDGLEELLDSIGEYNFDETSAGEVQAAVRAALDKLHENISVEDIEKIKELLEDKVDDIKKNSKSRKFIKKLIPFKDTDDNAWYTKYVAPIKELGIISGYKDKDGNELGEYRPGNNITIAEILKIALETSGKGSSNNGTPRLRAALAHWSKAYVKRAEELGVDLVTDSDTDLNRPATRGEVVRLFLEALGIDPDDITGTSFSDLSRNHPHAAFIEYAKRLGIVSGDSDADTFRPDDPINRAEAAKIANQIIEVILGGITN